MYLLALDILLNVVFRYPSDPAKTQPTAFQQYFENGRSVEGKFSRMTREMLNWGWVDVAKYRTLPTTSETEKGLIVAFYGMSHTEDLAKAVGEAHKNFIIRTVMAPGATPNWAFAAYQTDRDRIRATAVVLGIMTLGVPLVTTTSGATMHFFNSYPYTYPRYYLHRGKLRAEWPPFTDAEGFLIAFHSPEKWRQYRIWLSRNDRYYDPLLFDKCLLDGSTLGRLLRRAYAQRTREEKIARVYDSRGFNANAEEVAVLRSIVSEFASGARKRGTIPVIYLINNQGCGDHLLRAVKPILDSENIPYLSTEKICPPDDPRAFLPGADGHFTHEKNVELAGALIGLIEQERLKRK